MADRTVTIDRVQIKRSKVSGRRPPSLADGEEFVNHADGYRLFGDGVTPSDSLPSFPLRPGIDDVQGLGERLNGKQNSAAQLNALAALPLAEDRLLYSAGASALATSPLTALARLLLSGADANAMRAVLQLGSFSLSINRSDIPSRVIPFNSFTAIGFFKDYDLGYGATYRRGRANNAVDIQDKAGTWFTLSVADECSVGWTGAKGDVTTDDSAAFTLAASLANAVYIPAGRTYNVKNVDIPAGRRVYSNSRSSTSLRTLSGNPSVDFVIRLSHDSSLDNLTINGNNQVRKAISANSERISINNCKWQYAYYGFYNEGYDIHYLAGNVDENCQYAIYSAERWITCVIDRHGSFGSVYAVYLTYTVQQPQTLIISNSTFESNMYGFYSERDIYFLIIENTSYNNILLDGIYHGDLGSPGTGSDVFIKSTYISAAQRGLVVKPGWNHIVVESSGIADSKDSGASFQASATARTTNVTLRDVIFGQMGGTSIFADSVKSLLVDKCTFAPTGAAPYNALADFVTPTTYTAQPTPKGKARYCTFQKPVPIAPGSDFDISNTFQSPKGARRVIQHCAINQSVMGDPSSIE